MTKKKQKKFSVLIKKGQHIYPSEVADWHSVKMLVKNKLAIVGQYVDDASSEVVAMKKKLENAYRQFGIAKPEETDKKVEEKKSVLNPKCFVKFEGANFLISHPGK